MTEISNIFIQLDTNTSTNTNNDLIGDYFYVSDQQISASSGQAVTVAGPFCIDGPSIIELRLAATVNASSSVDDVDVRLYFDSTIVAESMVDDLEEPSNVVLFYRGRITSQTDIRIEIQSEGGS